MTITVQDMRNKLITLDQLQAQLAESEPMKSAPFTIGDAVRFEADNTWNHGVKAMNPDDPIPAYATLGIGKYARRYQLTRSTFGELCTTIGFKKDYAGDCPAELLVPHLNYWFREGMFTKSKKGKDFQLLIDDRDLAVAFTKQGMSPFSNLALLDVAAQQARNRYGAGSEILADYKTHHSLARTRLRLVLPGACRELNDTGTTGDVWSMGVQINNSLTGTSQTSIEGYLFRWVCTNGQIDTSAASGSYTRRKDASQDEVYAWARTAVDEVFSGLDGALDAVQQLTRVGIDGSVSDTLRDVFEHYRIPISLRPKIINILEQYDGEITMYVVMNAITEAANETGLDPNTVDALLRIGGDIPRTGDQRCGACHRLMHQH